MLNAIKTDSYRMFKTKSLWVIWMIMILLVFGTTSLFSTELSDTAQLYTEDYQDAIDQQPQNIGMNVIVPLEEGKPTTVFDMLFANLQGKFIALFIVIFSVLFSTADITSGYIKSIGGQIRFRSQLIISKSLLLFLYTLLTMGLFILAQTLANRIFFGYIEFGNTEMLFKYICTEILLHYSLALICMAIAIIARNNLFSMIISVLLCMNFMTLLYGFFDNIIAKAGVKDFNLLDFTVTGKISLLTMTITRSDILQGICIAASFGIVSTVICSLFFEKRDI